MGRAFRIYSLAMLGGFLGILLAKGWFQWRDILACSFLYLSCIVLWLVVAPDAQEVP